MFVHEKNWISTRASFVFKQVHFFSIFHSSLADQKKEEGNQLYLAKNYREALQRYNEAISKSYFSYSTAVHGGPDANEYHSIIFNTLIRLKLGFQWIFFSSINCCIVFKRKNVCKQKEDCRIGTQNFSKDKGQRYWKCTSFKRPFYPNFMASKCGRLAALHFLLPLLMLKVVVMTTVVVYP